MSKVDRESQARLDGMHYAVRRIKEIGMEEFEKELKWRGNHRIGMVELRPEELRKATTELYQIEYKRNIIISMLVLKDEFDFDTADLRRFNARCNQKTDSLIDKFIEWDDYEQILKDENGIDIEIDWR